MTEWTQDTENLIFSFLKRQQAKVFNPYRNFFVCVANWKEVVIYLHQEDEEKTRP